MNDPHVSIIILNWNGWEDTVECLESLFQINYPNFDVIVVDNASKDDSIQKIREYCSGQLEVRSPFFDYNPNNKPVTIFEHDNDFNDYKNLKNEKSQQNKLFLIKNEENYGFPGGNNRGIQFSLKFLHSDYVLLLNNDTVVDENFLGELVEKGESDRDIGILGPKIYFYYKPNTIWSAGCKISWKLSRGIQLGTNELDQGQYDEVKEVEYVSGSSFLINTEVIKKIGLMDENYFLYFEESDWTLRANYSGFKSIYVPCSKIWHKISKSGGGIHNPIGLYYITRNRWIFMKKWAHKSDYYFFIIYQIMGALVIPLWLIIHNKNSQLFTSYYRGLKDGINF